MKKAMGNYSLIFPRKSWQSTDKKKWTLWKAMIDDILKGHNIKKLRIGNIEMIEFVRGVIVKALIKMICNNSFFIDFFLFNSLSLSIFLR